MSDAAYRALVVDDETIARRTVMWALSNEDFHCIPAMDGVDALDKMKQIKYDLIVTDLRMPHKHGHALVTELLAGGAGYIPVIVAHSSIDDPSLTKDLMIRGIDDFVYKPTNYPAFAAKMKGLVVHRRSKRAEKRTDTTEAAHEAALPNQPHLSIDASSVPTVSIKELDARLADVTHILPVSNTFAEVLNLLSIGDLDARSLTKVIESDAVLTAELLRAANSIHDDRTQRKIFDLSEAIAKLGAKRIGEVSLAVGTLSGLFKLVLPWFDKDLANRRSLANYAAIKRILELQSHPISDNGIVFSAVTYPLIRAGIGSAYSNIYDTLITESFHKRTSLQSLERQVFPRTPTESLLQIFSNWRVPIEACWPLRHVDTSFESPPSLNEANKTSVKIFKTAILLGEHAAGKWMPWEEKPGLPSASIIESLNITCAKDFIDDVRATLALQR